MRFVPKSVQFVEMDIFFLRIDVPKERLSGKLGANKAVFAAYDSAVGKVEQFVEILLGDKRDFDQGNVFALIHIAVFKQGILRY